MADFQGILFDLDGTLLDTADDLGAALNYVLKKYGLPSIPPALYRPVASDGALGLLNLGFGDKLKDYNMEQLRKEFLTHYEENIAVHTKPYQGVEHLLTELNKQNIPWGIVTNKPIGLTQLLLPHFDIFDGCTITLGGDSLPVRKPSPEPLLHACQHLKISPSNCIYLGDAPRDIEAGNRAQMHSVIAEWGYIPAEEKITLWQADQHCTQPEQLLALLS